MKICRSCNAQLPDEFDRCLHCGSRLEVARAPAAERGAEEEAPVPDRPPVALEETVPLTVREPIFALELLAALAEAGVRFAVVDEPEESDARHRLRGTHERRVEVRVHRDDLERAEAIEQAVLRRNLPDLPEGYDPEAIDGEHCPACGALLRPHDPECPGCGLTFPEVEED